MRKITICSPNDGMKHSRGKINMTIEAGDRYLDLLSSFIEENTVQLVEGGLVLKLNPLGLHYVQSRLEALEELETLRIGAPVDYLRAYVADLGDHRAVEQLRRVLRLLSSVKVVARVSVPSSRNPTTVTLLPFSRLRSLELRNCDLSTSTPRGLLELRPILERLTCYNSAEALRHIFAERTKEIRGAPVWSRLSDVSCFGNGMVLMDESLQLLPAVEALDLGRNRFAKVANLQKCPNLKFLDVGFNHITTVASLNQILRGIVKLVLRNNALDTTRGLHNLSALEALDLSHNLISNVQEVELLGHLPSLTLLWLRGNPISFRRSYRREALSYFRAPTQLVLDGEKTSRLENCAAKRLAAWQVKHRRNYGAFIPAETQKSTDLSMQSSESEQWTSSHSSSREDAVPLSARGKSKRRSSRLAAISDVSEGSSAVGSVESALPLSTAVSLDSSLSESQESERKEETKGIIHTLMERAEVLKRTGSSTWLKDLNTILESDDVNKSQICEEIERRDEGVLQSKSLRKRNKKQLSRNGITNESGDMDTTSQGTRKPEGHHDEAESSHSRLSRQGSARENIAERSRESSILSRESSASLSRESSAKHISRETDPGQDSDFKGDWPLRHDFGKKLQDDPAVGLLRPIASYTNDGDQLKLPTQFGAFKVYEDLVTGSMSQNVSSSPPQFHQDLLHRRHTLERERLQLPPEVDLLADVSDSSSESGYSDLTDSSDDADRDTSSGWTPFRFDQDHNMDLTSGPKAEEDDRDDEAFQERAVSEEVHSRDENSQIDDSTDEGRGHIGQGATPTLEPKMAFGEWVDDQRKNGSTQEVNAHSEAVQAVGGEDEVFTIPAEETELAVGDVAHLPTTSVPDDSVEDVAHLSTTNVHEDSVPAACQNDGNRSFSSSSSPGDWPRSHKSTDLVQPKSKPSRRVVFLESSSGDFESAISVRSSRRSSDPKIMRRHSTSSSVIEGAAGQILPRSSSSVPFSQPLSIGRSSSIDQDAENERDWPRSRSQEESFPSTSLQTVESH